MTDWYRCPQCDGRGEETFHEGPHYGTDVCYHCCGERKITAEQFHQDLLRMVAGQLASQRVEAAKAAADRNPDGEGWAFAAAENGLTEYAYSVEKFMAYESKIMPELQALSQDSELLRALLDPFNDFARCSFIPETPPVDEIPF